MSDPDMIYRIVREHQERARRGVRSARLAQSQPQRTRTRAQARARVRVARLSTDGILRPSTKPRALIIMRALRPLVTRPVIMVPVLVLLFIVGCVVGRML